MSRVEVENESSKMENFRCALRVTRYGAPSRSGTPCLFLWAGFLVYRPSTAMNILQKIHREQMKSDTTELNVGDTVKIHNRVVEGGKERIQIFAGIIIGKGGLSKSQSIKVRKLSYGEGVERVYPIHSPLISKIEVTKRGQVRRAKLNYLRSRVGKDAVTVKEAPRK